ncbi:hypothetical protein Ccrd_014854 [Cynara cardunculus var. scolymus]|uniref:Uncharacterized protein n=1 Tax=Cynara cardunculus var. scolymus TaxID=59895 RepID=A0A118K410_CYNCS|nr:hypothetical protein Ccrd_014854 [Cynara cardunculus var. scolymus]
MHVPALCRTSETFRFQRHRKAAVTSLLYSLTGKGARQGQRLSGCDAMSMALNRGVDATDDWLLPSADCHLLIVLESGNSVTVRSCQVGTVVC